MRIRIAFVALLALAVAACVFAEPVRVVRPANQPVVKPQWWGPAPNPTPVVKGIVVGIGPDQITLNLERGAQMFAVTPKTEIFVEGKRATLADIRRGDPCVIKFQIQQTGPPIALAIQVRQPEQPRNPVVTGIVASVSADQITLNLPEGPRSAAVTRQTQVIVYGKKATIADVKVGMKAEVAFRPVEGGLPIALRINVPQPRAAGQIDAIDGNVLTVRGEKGIIWKITVPDGARIVCHGYQGTFADLRIGYRVGVGGQFNGNNVVAEVVEFAPIIHKGVVTAVDGSTITVATVEQTIITAQISEATIILVRPRVGPNRPGTLADIKVECPIDVGGHMSEGGPYQGGTMQALFADVLVAQ